MTVLTRYNTSTAIAGRPNLIFTLKLIKHFWSRILNFEDKKFFNSNSYSRHFLKEFQDFIRLSSSILANRYRLYTAVYVVTRLQSTNRGIYFFIFSFFEQLPFSPSPPFQKHIPFIFLVAPLYCLSPFFLPISLRPPKYFSSFALSSPFLLFFLIFASLSLHFPLFFGPIFSYSNEYMYVDIFFLLPLFVSF